jgi:hypothetical protein
MDGLLTRNVMNKKRRKTLWSPMKPAVMCRRTEKCVKFVKMNSNLPSSNLCRGQKGRSDFSFLSHLKRYLLPFYCYYAFISPLGKAQHNLGAVRLAVFEISRFILYLGPILLLNLNQGMHTCRCKRLL